MKKVLLFVALVGSMSMLQAQDLEKTSLKIEKFKGMSGMRPNPAVIQGFGSDENNYYVYHAIMSLFGKFDASFFVINKNLTSVKEYPLTKEKDDRFLWVQTSEEDLVILLARDKKGEEKTQIIKQSYAKTTGTLKKETAIVSFPKSKSEHWFFYSSTSPDKTKKCFLFMLANKKNSVDSYYAAVLNQDCKVEWDATHELTISNESFNVSDVAVNNKGKMYAAFYSTPKDKKSMDKNSYIDLIYLTDGSKEKMSFKIDEKRSGGQVYLKALQNNDIYLTGLFSMENDSKKDDNLYRKELLSIKVNGRTFNVEGNNKKLFEERVTKKDKNSYVPKMVINDILELGNGNIVILCEQSYNLAYTSNGITTYTKTRWSVTTIFVNGQDGAVESFNVMNKMQTHRSNFDCPAKSLHLSIFPFVYKDKVGYLFNDLQKRYATPEKYKDKTAFFKSANGDDACIVLNLQSEGNKSEITPLTGTANPAKRLVRQILFEEKDRLIVLTRNNKEAYVETLSLK